HCIAASTASPVVRTSIGCLRLPALFNTFTTCRTVDSCTFAGLISILVITTNTGIFSAIHSPKCSFAIPIIPALLPTTNIPYSGCPPASPNTVVRKYFSCPAKSWNTITFAARLHISFHSNFRSLLITSPLSRSNPITSIPILDVRPVSCSCLCRNILDLALPRPLSNLLRVSTPNTVDFPASTFPIIAIRTSTTSSTLSTLLRIK
ncbi:hypothetical protein AX774_g6424, partial [Zancudomyces culisetae]